MRHHVRILLIVISICLVTSLALAGSDDDDRYFQLTVLHNNDGESQLINAGSGVEDFGGIARFATLVRNLRIEALFGSGDDDDEDNDFKDGDDDEDADHRGVILLSSGDNFLAGPEFNASLERGVPFYDSIALRRIRYDAFCIGNHEFDFGPDILSDFIVGFGRRGKFLSANLDYSSEPFLQDLEDRGRLAKSKIIRKFGKKIGVIGVTTEELASISTPRDVVVNAVLPAVQAEIERLNRKRVKIIILISHLQSVDEDIALLAQLKDVDIVIAGGGDEVLANSGDLLVPGDTIFAPYPIIATDMDGVEVPVVTTAGDYKYVGRLIARFDKAGRVVAIDEKSGPVRVAGGAQPDAVKPDRFIQKKVVEPVAESVAQLAENVIGLSEVALEGRRNPGIRTEETNLGNLVADALLAQATLLATNEGLPVPDVALQNGGGIRNNSLIPAGEITELTTFDILPFSNFVTVIPDIPHSQFKEILENAVSRVESVSGRFAQVAGFAFTYDSGEPPQEVDDDGNVLTPGNRVREVILNDGTVIVSNGVVSNPAATLTVATIDFLARGGDQYPYRGAPFTLLGVSYQQALLNYIVDNQNGLISADQYPEGGEGRITVVSGP
ncbi:MAG: 5'-nucleotidase C-terminal domain-containing protein [Desulfobacterales bacterium]